MNFHPAANAFPMMDKDRLNSLSDSIRVSGLQVPILLFEGQILDGRNRSLACTAAGVEPRYEQWLGGDPYEHAWNLNAERRDLSPGQRMAIRILVLKASGEWQATQKKMRAETNERRRATTKAQPRSDGGLFAEPTGDLSRDKRPETTHNHTHERLAVEAQVSPATAARVQSLANKRPDLLHAVAEGDMGLAEATRQAKREDVKEKLEQKALAPVAELAGAYDVLVIVGHNQTTDIPAQSSAQN